MGLFLQKVNIIRDYLEDLIDGRTFWPSEVWSIYVPSLSSFRDEAQYRDAALTCLNHLITNALHHVPDCLAYMKGLKNKSVFKFCAIPQVMAIATLALCYDNYQVFQTNVKIRKGLAVKVCVCGRHLFLEQMLTA
jgi:farnesyl-diphosphate farnesyltransferase